MLLVSPRTSHLPDSLREIELRRLLCFHGEMVGYGYALS